jgi:hypothetical protein
MKIPSTAPRVLVALPKRGMQSFETIYCFLKTGWPLKKTPDLNAEHFRNSVSMFEADYTIDQ